MDNDLSPEDNIDVQEDEYSDEGVKGAVQHSMKVKEKD